MTESEATSVQVVPPRTGTLWVKIDGQDYCVQHLVKQNQIMREALEWIQGCPELAIAETAEYALAEADRIAGAE